MAVILTKRDKYSKIREFADFHCGNKQFQNIFKNSKVDIMKNAFNKSKIIIIFCPW